MAPETGATGFVPSVHGNDVVLGLWPEYDFAGHDLPQQLGPDVGPWNRRSWICHVLGPAPIKLSALIIGQFQRRVPLNVGETVPRRHRELGTIAGGQLEQLGERARWHIRMVSRLG
ncbi:MAG: hypothetical protein ACT4QD_22155 [Acidobacteriota bacterium]